MKLAQRLRRLKSDITDAIEGSRDTRALKRLLSATSAAAKTLAESRSASLTPKRRREIARNAAKARWSKRRPTNKKEN